MSGAQLDRTDHTQIFIDGEWTTPHGTTVLEDIDPAHGTIWATCVSGDAEDVDRAVSAAGQAFTGRAWSQLAPVQRGKLLNRLADLVGEHSQSLAAADSRSSGTLYRESLAGDITFAQEVLRYFGGWADKIEGRTIPVGGTVSAATFREPVGVIGAIIPWNAPISSTAWKLAPALAAGCTVVLKPSEYSSTSAFELMNLIDQAGFPPGVVNLVPGTGASVGDPLVRHPGVSKIAFTGSNATASQIMATAAPALKRVSFECGGRNPMLVFDDCDIEQASIVATVSSFIRAGQACSLGSRLYVQRGIFDEFIERLCARADRIVVGDPFKDASQMGPIAHADQLAKVERYVRFGAEEGAELLAGGRRPDTGVDAGGLYFRPTVLRAADNSLRVVQEEIFGPVVTVAPFDDEDEAVALANDTRFGLTAGIWTNDVRRAQRLPRRLNAGTVWVNTYRFIHWALPYGGRGLSGFGRENGAEALDLYTETKTVIQDAATSRPDPYDPNLHTAISLQGVAVDE